MLDPRTQPKFINSLPSPMQIDATEGGTFTLEMRETEQWLGLYESPGADGEYGTEDDEILNTTIWGYGLPHQEVTYPGPTIISQRDVPMSVLWQNKLPMNKEGGHLLPLESHIPIMTPVKEALDDGYIPTVVHLHGSHVEPDSDGYPLAWYTQNYDRKGSEWVKEVYTYENTQEAGTLWYHDHAMSITRLNVYAGLTGFNLLRDDNENELIEAGVLPSDSYEREIVIQDRRFTDDGELFYSSDTSNNIPGVLNPTGVYGDFILANGMAWPVLEVEPRKYRLRFLNGSDSRFYTLGFDRPDENMYQIGRDLGFFERPIVVDEVDLAPAQRVDIVVDFSNDLGEEFILTNTFSGGGSADTGQIMKFVVNQPLSDVPIATIDTDETDGLTTRLRLDDITIPEQTGATRQLVLFQEDSGSHSEFLLGTVEDGSLNFSDPVTETPVLGTTEVWEIYNTTNFPHPVHLHLVNFQLLNSQSFGGTLITAQDTETGEIKQYLQDIGLFGDPTPPNPSDSGLIDTAIVEARQMIRITATFDKPGTYVWHCHMLIHEDHDMMRPFEVVPASDADIENDSDAFNGSRGVLIAENDESDDLLRGGRSDEIVPPDFTVISEQQLVPGSDNNLSSGDDFLSVNSFWENSDSDYLSSISISTDI